MGKFLGTVLLTLSLFLPSCGAFKAIDETRQLLAENKANIAASVADAKAIVAVIKDVVEKVRPAIEKLDLSYLAGLSEKLIAMKADLSAEFKSLRDANSAAFDKADADKNGKLNTLNEWLNYLLGAGGVGLAAALAMLKRLSGQVTAAKALANEAHERLDSTPDVPPAKVAQ